MKKSLWGYSIHEVDENINYLETQNLKLEKQVKQLTADLEKAKTELELSATASSTDAAVAENEKTISALRAELESVQTAYMQYKTENERLSAEIAQKTAEISEQSAAFTEVGNICRLAYEDMHHTKQKTKESIEKFLSSFWDEWKKYQQQVCALADQMKLQQQESRRSFIESADRILQTYGSMEQQNQAFDSNLSEIIGTKDRLQSELEGILAELQVESETGEEQTDVSDASGEPQAAQEKEGVYSIIQAIKILSETRGASKTDQKEDDADETLPDSREDESAVPSENFDEGFSLSPNVNVRNII